MKRSLLFIFVLLTAILSAVAQPRVFSDKETRHFGQIERKHPVPVEYTITNTGGKPLVLINVTTSYACSIANQAKIPIAPGGEGTVGVTFDTKASGCFSKSISIYNNTQPGLVYLNFDGEMVQKIKDFTKTHPYAVRQVRIDRTGIDFPDVHSGEKPVITLGVVSLSDRPYEPVLMHLPPCLKMETNPTVLLKGKKGTITLTLDTEQLMDLGLTQPSVYLVRFTGGKVSEENGVLVSAAPLPDLSGMTRQGKAPVPTVHLSEPKIDSSRASVKRNKAQHDIAITNTGKPPLQVSKLQVFNPTVGAVLKETILQPGESTRPRVTILKKSPRERRRHLRVLMVTDDLVQPKVEIDVKATSNKSHN